MQGEFPVVVRENGRKFIPSFPVTLRGGDRLILVREVVEAQVPEGNIWVTEGYYWGIGGPLVPCYEAIKHE